MKDTAILLIIACIFTAFSVGQIAISNSNVIAVNVRDNDSSFNFEVSDEDNESVIRTEPININTASEDLLCSISGIGEVRAASIIEYRETNGNFTSVEDLLNVKGIGEAILEMMRPYITV